jgi:hypothetical protein
MRCTSNHCRSRRRLKPCRDPLIRAAISVLKGGATSDCIHLCTAHAGGPKWKAYPRGRTSIVTGGTGAPDFVPVITKFGVHWRNGQGRLECLALAPSAKAGDPGSGNFDTNVMYVTGTIESVEVHGKTAELTGKAKVTGLGAGSNLPFTAKAERGGPGTQFVLTVSGLTFDEIVLDGQIEF